MRRPPSLTEITRCLLAAGVTVVVAALAFRGSQAAEGALVLALGTVFGFVFRSKLVPPDDRA